MHPDLRDPDEDLFRALDELQARILTIENSLLFRLIRWPGRIALGWRGWLGQRLLHSPFHPLYLKLTRGDQPDPAYQAWVRREQAAIPPRPWFDDQLAGFAKRPLCSILMPVHNPPRAWLEAAIESVRGQIYPHWELAICDDSPAALDYLQALTAGDPRIRTVRADQRLGIAGALNRAAELASGEYLAFLDHDDVLAPYALYYLVEALQHGDRDLLYSDEDRLNDAGARVEPVFKPAWSPDLLLNCMYLGHLTMVKSTRFRQAGGFRAEYEGSQDHDLALRLTDGRLSDGRLSDEPCQVRHVPRVLYHWRKHAGSTAAASSAKPYAQQAGLRAVEDTLHRRHWDATVELRPRPNTYRVRFAAERAGKAALIICSRREDLLRGSLRAIGERTDYADRQVVVIQHGVRMAPEVFHAGFDCAALWYGGEFNFARMNNLGAKAAAGDWLVFLNDDVTPLDATWLSQLAGHVSRPEVGIVGARLLYPSGAIQHAGLATGIMEGAGHPHRHMFGSRYWNRFELTREVSAVTGACLAIRRAVFEELGGFDEQFPVNYNDVDLCLRAGARGYRVILEPAAVLRHAECQTRTPGVLWRERYRWWRKWPLLQVGGDPFYSPHLSVTREDASLRMDEPFGPDDNSR